MANTVRLCNYPSPCRIFESLLFKNCGFMNSQWIVPQTIILMLNLSQNRLVVGFFQAGSCVLPICLHHSLRTFLLFHIKCSSAYPIFFPSPPWNHPFHQEALVSFRYLKANTQVLNVFSAPGVSQAQDLTENRPGVYTHTHSTHQHTSTSVYSPVWHHHKNCKYIHHTVHFSSLFLHL